MITTPRPTRQVIPDPTRQVVRRQPPPNGSTGSTTAAPSSTATTSHRSKQSTLTTLTTGPRRPSEPQTRKSADSPGRFRLRVDWGPGPGCPPVGVRGDHRAVGAQRQCHEHRGPIRRPVRGGERAAHSALLDRQPGQIHHITATTRRAHPTPHPTQRRRRRRRRRITIAGNRRGAVDVLIAHLLRQTAAVGTGVVDGRTVLLVEGVLGQVPALGALLHPDPTRLARTRTAHRLPGRPARHHHPLLYAGDPVHHQPHQRPTAHPVLGRVLAHHTRGQPRTNSRSHSRSRARDLGAGGGRPRGGCRGGCRCRHAAHRGTRIPRHQGLQSDAEPPRSVPISVTWFHPATPRCAKRPSTCKAVAVNVLETPCTLTASLTI